MSNVPFTIVDQDYPALFQVADAASQREQAFAVSILKKDLFLTVGGTVLVIVAEALTIVPLSFPASFPTGIPRWIPAAFWIAGAMCLCYSTVLTMTLKRNNHEEGWYGGRAIAETIKTLAWRYMVRAKPYGGDLNADDAQRVFRDDLTNVLKNYRQIVTKLAGQSIAREQVTNRMRDVRNASFEVRKATYVKYRLENQQQWYASKATESVRWGDRIFNWAVGFQSLTLLFAAGAFYSSIYQVPNSSIFLSIASACAAGALAFLGWSQFRQYQEFAYAYSIAAQELGSLISLSQRVLSGDLATFVMDAENAISREHTLWIGRRDKHYYPDQGDIFGKHAK